jgi:hypothetical protein
MEKGSNRDQEEKTLWWGGRNHVTLPLHHANLVDESNGQRKSQKTPTSINQQKSITNFKYYHAAEILMFKKKSNIYLKILSAWSQELRNHLFIMPTYIKTWGDVQAGGISSLTKAAMLQDSDSNISDHQNHMEKLAPSMEFLVQWIWGGPGNLHF